MNALLAVILFLMILGGGVYLLVLATKLVNAVEKIANSSYDKKHV
jgi:hypothetical protein